MVCHLSTPTAHVLVLRHPLRSMVRVCFVGCDLHKDDSLNLRMKKTCRVRAVVHDEEDCLGTDLEKSKVRAVLMSDVRVANV